MSKIRPNNFSAVSERAQTYFVWVSNNPGQHVLSIDQANNDVVEYLLCIIIVDGSRR